MTADFTTTNVNMSGGSDGSILIEPFNGTPPYEYSIDGGMTWFSSALFDNLPEGDYEVVVRDDVDCTADGTVTIEACLLEVSAVVTDASTGSSADGIINVATNNGTAPFEYSIDGVNFQDTNQFDNLGAGEYTVYIIDATGCTRELTVTVGSTVNTGEKFFGYDLQVYPNPTSNVLQIQLKGLAGVSTLWVQVFDATGRQVKIGRLVSYSDVLVGQISLQTLATGNYFLRFNHPEFNRMIKVQKVD